MKPYEIDWSKGFQIGQEWISPKGNHYKVFGSDSGHAVLKPCGKGGRRHLRGWLDVNGWKLSEGGES